MFLCIVFTGCFKENISCNSTTEADTLLGIAYVYTSTECGGNIRCTLHMNITWGEDTLQMNTLSMYIFNS